MAKGRNLSGKTTIPVGDMAKTMLDKIFPHLSPAQLESLKGGTPMPPSADWVGHANVSVGPIPVVDATDARVREAGDELSGARRAAGLLRAAAAVNAAGPLISCVMVFGDRNRLRRARKAVGQFLAQTYANKQLVIVNAADTPVTTEYHREVKEVAVPSGGLTGGMRNAGLDAADGDAAFPFWDDDDVYDPNLLFYLASAYQGTKAVILTTQVRVDIKHTFAYVHVEPHGVPNTILVPRSDARFPDQTGGEDYAFWTRHWGVKSRVVDNSAWPENTLLMRVFDGNNVATLDHFMRPKTPAGLAYESMHGMLQLGADVGRHVKAVLATFGLRTEVRSPTEKPVAT